ncbi:MAG: DUF2079 domain-containing protein [Thermomicrobiales bacterium]
MHVTDRVASVPANDTRRTAPTPTHVALDAVDRYAPALLAALVVAWIALFTLISMYWRDNLRWGFDVVDYSQPMWNTMHGRIWEVSLYDWTATELGHDLVPLELILAPLYQFLGGTMALIVIQCTTAALGGIGAYVVTRMALPARHRGIGLLATALYLSLAFLQRTTVADFQARSIIMWTFFFAWYGYRTRRPWLVWTMLCLALLSRSDVGLVVAAFGIYSLLERRRWRYSWLPIAVGATWFVLVVYVIVPHFSKTGFIYEDNYGWLGGGVSGIVKSVLTRPWYVMQGVVTGDKLRYTFDLLFPFAFLPLLKPRILLIPLPIYLLNVLSNYDGQYKLIHHYNALIVPFLMIAAIEAIADVAERRGLAGALTTALLSRVRMWRPTGGIVAATLCALMLLCSFVQNQTVTSPAQSYLLHHDPSARAQAGRQLVRMVPRDAPLAVTTRLGGVTPMRQHLYMFPGDPRYHNPALVDRADYIMGDTQRTPMETAAIERYRTDPAWEVVDERGGFILMRKRQPGGGA